MVRLSCPMLRNVRFVKLLRKVIEPMPGLLSMERSVSAVKRERYEALVSVELSMCNTVRLVKLVRSCGFENGLPKAQREIKLWPSAGDKSETLLKPRSRLFKEGMWETKEMSPKPVAAT